MKSHYYSSTADMDETHSNEDIFSEKNYTKMLRVVSSIVLNNYFSDRPGLKPRKALQKLSDSFYPCISLLRTDHHILEDNLSDFLQMTKSYFQELNNLPVPTINAYVKWLLRSFGRLDPELQHKFVYKFDLLLDPHPTKNINDVFHELAILSYNIEI